jgi:hypothetical protein
MRKLGFFVIGLVIFSLAISFVSIFGVFSNECFAQPTTWYRTDLLCPDDKYEKTYCYTGGPEQCEEKKCPPPPYV